MREEPGKEGQITIKLNDRQTSYHEDQKPQAKDLLENVQLETAAARDHSEADFDWILPETGTEPKIFKQANESKDQSVRKHNENRRNFFHTFSSLLFSIAFAIGLGIAFGLILLNFISAKETPATTESTTAPNTEAPTNQSNNGTTNPVIFPAFSTYIIQGGIFSNQEAANTLSTQLSEKGIPSEILMMDDGSYYVFLGLASTETEAKQLAGILKEKGAEVFTKPYELKEKSLAGVQSTNATLVNQSVSALPVLFDIAGKMALGQGIPEDALNKVSTFATELNEIKAQDGTVNEWTQLFLQASQKIEKYSQTKGTEDAFEVQQILLSYIKMNHDM